MERKKFCVRTVTRGGLSWPSAYSHSVRRRRGRCLALGIVGAFLTAEIYTAQSLLAQSPGPGDTAGVLSPRLTVRPHAIKIATKTNLSFQLTINPFESIGPPSWFYAPKQCQGTGRCPLIVLSHMPSELYLRVQEFYLLVADKYGMILAQITPEVADSSRLAAFDRGMTELLQPNAVRQIAVDPDKIVIAGCCASATTAEYGTQNPDVFSRVVVFTPRVGDPPVKSPAHANEYYVADGLLENAANFRLVRRLRDHGYTVKHTFQFRDHDWQYEDYDFLGHWLQESWAIPDPGARPAPPVFGDPPQLTVESMTHMTAFWTRFMQEPDSIKTAARRTHVREVAVPVGKERVSIVMVDMPALAAQYPSVAAAFKAAGLTPQQHDGYRAALASARMLVIGDELRALLAVKATSAMAKNVEFLRAHPNELAALEATGMWSTP